MSQVPPADVNSVNLFEDKTPNQIILNRILMNSIEIARATDLSDSEGGDVVDLVVVLARKLLSVWRHQQAYQVEEDSLAQQCTSWPATRREYSQELYEEFDVLSVQVKSTLDHLVQIMRPVLGGARWSMYSFGEKGEKVLAALRNNSGPRHAAHVRMMEAYVFTNTNKQWLTEIIGQRDKINHGMGGGIKIQRFGVFRDGTGTVHLPMWNGEQRMSDALGLVWGNVFRYVEDFIALGLNFRLKKDWGLRRQERDCQDFCVEA